VSGARGPGTLHLPRVPVGLEDVSKYVELFSALYGSGQWTVLELKKLAGLNFLRVWREVEKVGIAKSNVRQERKKDDLTAGAGGADPGGRPGKRGKDPGRGEPGPGGLQVPHQAGGFQLLLLRVMGSALHSLGRQY
jgi:hypothetical protein